MFLEPDTYPGSYRALLSPSLTVNTLYEQGSSDVNEDILIASGRLFGVFDGATSLDKHVFADGRTGGRLAAELAAAAFLHGDGTLSLRAELANLRIRQALGEHAVPMHERHRLWSTSLAVVRLEEDRFEYCQTGDAHILVIKDDDTFQLITPDIDIDGETLMMWKSAQYPAGTAIHTVLADQIRDVRLKMNREYGVLNGEAEAMTFLRHGFVDLEGITDILLFTDGLFLPREEISASQDWSHLIDLYQEGGLSAIHHRVRSLQKSDPHCHRFPRFKCHDDIAAITISLETAHQAVSACL